MIQWLASAQQVVVGGVLLWASALKLLSRNAPAAARRSALRRLVGTDRVVTAYRTVGGAELAVGALLLAPPAFAGEAWLAVVLSAGMIGYLGYAKWQAPDSSCGCLGDKHTPVRWRGFARAGVLLVASLLAVPAAGWWTTDRPLATVAAVAGSLVLIGVLSPELDRRWLYPLRRWRIRLRHPLASRSVEVPLASTVQQLQRSTAYRSVSDQLRSDLLDTWDEGEWRILTYAAGPATAVFAVPLLDYRPDDIRVALVPTEAEEGALV